MPEEYLDYYRRKNEDHERSMWESIHETLNGRVNHRNEGIQIVMRMAHRKSLNALYTAWIEWINENKEKLNETDCGKSYIERYQRMQENAQKKPWAGMSIGLQQNTVRLEKAGWYMAIPAMQRVESSNIHSVGYDPAKRELYVRFNNGGLYV